MFDNKRDLENRARSAAAAGRWAEVVTACRGIVSRDAGDLAARQRLAEALFNTGNPAEAAMEYEAVARGYLAEGFVLKAMAAGKQVLALDPGRTAIRDLLAQATTSRRGAPAAAPPAPRAEDSAELHLPAVAAPAVAAPPAEPSDRIHLAAEPEVVLDLARVPYIPLFGDLSREQFAEVFSSLDVHLAAAGDVVTREGEAGDRMFVVVQGALAVQRPGRTGPETVAALHAGACFGEMALVARCPRLATVVATENCVLLELTRAALVDIVRRHPAVAAVVERFHKTRLLHNVLRASPLFRPLSSERLGELVDAFRHRHADDGEEIIRQGTAASALYILLRGRCAVSRHAAGGAQEELPVMAEGDVFGEISLILSTQATATVRAAGPCELLVLPAEAFDRLVRSDREVARGLASVGEARLRRMGVEVDLEIWSA